MKNPTTISLYTLDIHSRFRSGCSRFFNAPLAHHTNIRAPETHQPEVTDNKETEKATEQRSCERTRTERAMALLLLICCDSDLMCLWLIVVLTEIHSDGSGDGPDDAVRHTFCNAIGYSKRLCIRTKAIVCTASMVDHADSYKNT